MKISVDEKEVLNLSPTRQLVIQNDIPSEIFREDMERRVAYIIEHKYEQCFKRLKQEWEPRLAAKGIAMLPTNADEFAELVFSQPEYKDRSARDKVSQ